MVKPTEFRDGSFGLKLARAKAKKSESPRNRMATISCRNFLNILVTLSIYVFSGRGERSFAAALTLAEPSESTRSSL